MSLIPTAKFWIRGWGRERVGDKWEDMKTQTFHSKVNCKTKFHNIRKNPMLRKKTTESIIGMEVHFRCNSFSASCQRFENKYLRMFRNTDEKKDPSQKQEIEKTIMYRNTMIPDRKKKLEILEMK